MIVYLKTSRSGDVTVWKDLDRALYFGGFSPERTRREFFTNRDGELVHTLLRTDGEMLCTVIETELR